MRCLHTARDEQLLSQDYGRRADHPERGVQAGDRAAETEHHQRAEELATIVTHSSDAIITTAPDGVIDVTAELPPHMQPARIEWREHLPVGPNGKLDRATLKAELQ